MIDDWLVKHRTKVCTSLAIALIAVTKPPQTLPPELSHTQSDGPLLCVEPVFDFGEIWKDEPIEAYFDIQNVSDAQVWFRMRYACACAGFPTVFRADAKSSVRIPFTLSAKKLRGAIDKKIDIEIIDDQSHMYCGNCGYRRHKTRRRGLIAEPCGITPISSIETMLNDADNAIADIVSWIERNSKQTGW